MIDISNSFQRLIASGPGAISVPVGPAPVEVFSEPARLRLLFCSNPTTESVTLTIVDQGSLDIAATIAANDILSVNFAGSGLAFVGSLSWSASAAGLNAFLQGEY